VIATLLVIEDNRDNIALMDYLLRAHGYNPLLASNGEDGVRLAAEQRPDLILLDIQMPGMDGYQTAAAIRREVGLEATPIIAVTSFAMVGDREKTLASGFDGYLSKPIVPESFVSEIEQFLPEGLRAQGGATAGPR
jgi:CheY-like chemotaxis protein